MVIFFLLLKCGFLVDFYSAANIRIHRLFAVTNNLNIQRDRLVVRFITDILTSNRTDILNNIYYFFESVTAKTSSDIFIILGKIGATSINLSHPKKKSPDINLTFFVTKPRSVDIMYDYFSYYISVRKITKKHIKHFKYF